MKFTDPSIGYNLWQNAVQEKDWKDALDFLIASLREALIFDNLAIYIIDKSGATSEIVYARAIGREKDAEADASWGEELANQVIEKEEIILEVLKKPGTIKTKRITDPYLIGLPLKASGKLIGVLTLVRFGGPEYKQRHIDLATLASAVIAYIFEKRALQETIAELEAAQRQMRLQDDFVATISHELRTPLGFIKGYSTTLLREDTLWDEGTRREFLTIIDEETDHLTELIENILESARLESGTIEMSFQPLRLDALIRDVITRVRVRYPDLEIIFRSESSKIIQGDNKRLAQIFENLFSNAVKYAPQSKIEISINAVQPSSIQVVFADHGTGISAKHLPYIFDRFYRVPDHPGKSGTGLGLFICKRIIEVHHGKIWAESNNQEGTQFIIQLPTQ